MLAQLQPPGGFPDPLVPYSDLLSDLFVFLVTTAIILAIGRLVVAPFLLRVVRNRNRNNPTVVSATETYVQVLVAGTALLAGLLAAGQLRFLIGTDSAIIIAALTFAFSVAGQEVFGSLISGFFLVADPDFNVGDWISWAGGEGVVEAVDFRVTRIRTADNETVIVPNTELTTNALTRPFGRDRYRITERAYVSYTEDTEHALMELQQLAANFDRVVDEPPPNARVLDLGPDNITVRAELWIDDPGRGDVADVRSDFRRAVKRRFDEEGLTLAPASGTELSGEVTVDRAG